MLKRIQCKGLNGRLDLDQCLHSDINIVVGKNGSGKTNLLKLLWYSISGNIERIVSEIPLDWYRVESTGFWLEMSVERAKGRRLAAFKYDIGEGEKSVTRDSERRARDDAYTDLNRRIMRTSGSSVFFPTFRRIEGGFSIQQRDEGPYFRHAQGIVYSNSSSLASAMEELSQRLTNGPHHFVASISTADIVTLLTKRYADISEKTNRLHTDLSHFILDTQLEDQQGDAASLLGRIRTEADNVKKSSEALLRPFTVLSNLIETIFQYRGIRMADAITLGEVTEAISSDVLSAGEKQMLSFLCYNAFTANSSVFIDEPEISLHVDWQRILFPTLMSQSSTNQFIVATHSPFIYSKYADKELVLSEDRGTTDAIAAPDRE